MHIWCKNKIDPLETEGNNTCYEILTPKVVQQPCAREQQVPIICGGDKYSKQGKINIVDQRSKLDHHLGDV